MPEEGQESRDASMLDVSGSGDLAHSFSQMNVDEPWVPRRKSGLIFDEDDVQAHHNEHGSLSNSDDEASISSVDSQEGIAERQSSTSSTRLVREPATVVAEPLEPVTAPEPVVGEAGAFHSMTEKVMVPVDITWQQGGERVYVTGSFTGWRKMIGLVPSPGNPGTVHVKLQLPPGTHRFRFIVDNQLRFSDFLPTATDQMGNFVNYIEIPSPRNSPVMSGSTPLPHSWEQPSAENRRPPSRTSTDSPNTQNKKQPVSARSRIALEIEKEPDDMGNGYSRFRDESPSKPLLEYTQDIPAVFTDPNVMEQYYLTLDQQQNNHQNMAWLTPPQLPPHLENVILNNYSNPQGDINENNSGALPIPNHVILNHLATSSIKHNTLCVASIVRYKRKYVTQILYAPLQ